MFRKHQTQAGPRIMQQSSTQSAPTPFRGSGEMAQLCRAFDWAATPLGPVDGWSHSLRTTVSIMLASRHPMFIWWGPQLIQIYNDAYRPSFAGGGRHPKALGMPGAEFWTDIWHIIGPQIEGVMTEGRATWHEDHLVPIIRNDRLEPVYWTYGYSPVYDDDGSIGGTLVVCTETTRRVEAAAERERLIEAERAARADAESARALLMRVFEQAPVAIAVLHGRELRYTVANPRYRQIIGGRDPIGLALTEMFPELTGSPIEGVLHGVIETGRPFVADDLLIRFDSQGEGAIDNYYDLVYHPLSDGDTVTDIVVVAVDVTQRRHAAVERERLLAEAESARTEAELANRAKSEFLAVMSHELRTPLNAISGYAEILELGVHGPLTDAQRLDLSRIQMSQRHLLGLINGLLNYTRVEAGAVHFAIADVPVAEVLAACHALTSPQAEAAQLTFTVACNDTGLGVRAAAEKLQQIVLNLLTNAIKFTDAGGRIELRGEAAGGNVEITVTDTGRGIPAERLAHIFEPFVQVDARLTRSTGGIGLGLAISRDLARAMNGDLTAESTPGVGSRFMLRMPRAEAAAAALPGRLASGRCQNPPSPGPADRSQG
jgi:signal transduction histidine kinase